jgi:hypothetical protein
VCIQLLLLYHTALQAERDPPGADRVVGAEERKAEFEAERESLWRACLEVLRPTSIADGAEGARSEACSGFAWWWEMQRPTQRMAWRVLLATGRPVGECQVARDRVQLEQAAAALEWCAERFGVWGGERTPPEGGVEGTTTAAAGVLMPHAQSTSVLQTFVCAAQAMRHVAKLRPANFAAYLALTEAGGARLLGAMVALLEVMLADTDHTVLDASVQEMVAVVVDVLCGSVQPLDGMLRFSYPLFHVIGKLYVIRYFSESR